MSQPASTTSSYERIKDIYFSALELPVASRVEYVNSCSLNDEERREVNSLLAAENNAGSFLNEGSALSAVQSSYANVEEALIGEKIGDYRIIREIGRGGMGIVYLAEREAFRQVVAIKVIKRGMDTDAIVDSFVRERQILAALNHRYIANLLDGGTTADGRPYFVMEYVDGIPVDKFCDSIGTSDQLDIFIKICSAVTFAHSKLIVHRDIKPSNILINGENDPKLLDFGIAKLLDADERTLTRTGLRAMTPEYASPEQVSGGIVGTETDVYSLGRVLQKILKKDLKDTGTGQRSHNLPSDLSNILAKALHKDVDRRYRSVEAFAEDLKRYLENKPVSAKPDALGYRTRKFIKRNRLVVSFGLIVLLTLVGGLGATLWKAREAQAERALAERRFENLRRLSSSLITELHSAIRDLPGSMHARQLLLARAKEQLDTLAEESGENEALTEELAKAYHNLAQLPDMPLSEKKTTNEKAIASFTALSALHADNMDLKVQLAGAELALADILKLLGSVGDASRHCRAAVALLEEGTPPGLNDKQHLETLLAGLHDLSFYEMQLGEFHSSAQTAKKVVETASRLTSLLDADKARDIRITSHLASASPLMHLGQYREARSELNASLDALEQHIKIHPNDTSIPYRLWAVKRRLGTISMNEGDLRTAEKTTAEALAVMDGLIATSPRDVGYQRNAAITHILLGQVMMRSGEPRTATARFTKALDLSESVLAGFPDSFESKIDVARELACLGNALAAAGETEQAIEYLSRAVANYAELVRTDTENALLQRDFAEACDWMAAATQRVQPDASQTLRDSAAKTWTLLIEQQKLSAADLSAH